MLDNSNSDESQARLTKILVAVLAILLVVILSMLLRGGEQTAQVATPSRPLQLPPDKITLAQFLNLDDGISFDSAVRRLGGKYGTEISRTTLGGMTTVMYQWQNDDASNMNAMFQDGRLVSKSQFGLK